MHNKSLQLCLTLCDPIDCSLPGSSVHGLLQARVLKWVAMPSSRGSSQPRDRTHVSFVFCIGRRFFFFFFFFLPLAPPENPVNTSIITKLSFLWWKHLRSTLSNFGQHIKRQRHYFADKGPSSQSYGFPVVMYRCESWTTKKAEPGRIYAFELWYWRRLLRVPWTGSSSNQSILRKSVQNIHWKDWF